jgi:hypothetical protein
MTLARIEGCIAPRTAFCRFSGVNFVPNDTASTIFCDEPYQSDPLQSLSTHERRIVGQLFPSLPYTIITPDIGELNCNSIGMMRCLDQFPCCRPNHLRRIVERGAIREDDDIDRLDLSIVRYAAFSLFQLKYDLVEDRLKASTERRRACMGPIGTEVND